MFDFIKKIFNENSSKQEDKIDDEIIHKEEIEIKFFDRMLNENEYLCCEKRDKIFDRFSHKTNSEDETQLTKEEKQELGLNVRMKITKEYVELFDKNKIKEINPKNEFQLFCVSVISRVNTEISVLKLKNAGIEEIEVNTELGDCDWCKELNNKILATEEVLKLVQNPKCTCRYSLITRPIIKLDEDN